MRLSGCLSPFLSLPRWGGRRFRTLPSRCSRTASLIKWKVAFAMDFSPVPRIPLYLRKVFILCAPPVPQHPPSRLSLWSISAYMRTPFHLIHKTTIPALISCPSFLPTTHHPLPFLVFRWSPQMTLLFLYLEHQHTSYSFPSLIPPVILPARCIIWGIPYLYCPSSFIHTPHLSLP